MLVWHLTAFLSIQCSVWLFCRRLNVKPVPCGAERAACAACYAEAGDNPLPCAAAVEAYVACAQRAYESFVK